MNLGTACPAMCLLSPQRNLVLGAISLGKCRAWRRLRVRVLDRENVRGLPLDIRLVRLWQLKLVGEVQVLAPLNQAMHANAPTPHRRQRALAPTSSLNHVVLGTCPRPSINQDIRR